MHVKKHLSFTALRKKLSNRLLEMEDNRDQGKVNHSIHDCFMSGFAMMFFQDPSLMSFQRRMKEGRNMSYILIAKPKDHKLMMEWVSEQKIMGNVARMEYKDKKGRKHVGVKEGTLESFAGDISDITI